MTQVSISAADKAAVVAAIDPDAYGAATYTTGWVDMAKWQQILAVIMAGTLGSGATIDAKLQQATDSSGTGAKDVTDSAITQLTQAGSDSDKQVVIACAAENLDVNNSFTHARLSVTVGTATSDMGALVLGMAERYGPASGADAATVDQIVRLDG